MSTEFKVKRTGRPALKFFGELLAEAGSRRVNGAERQRWHEISLYKTNKGNFVVWVAYRTLWQGETGYDWVESFDNLKALFNSLQLDYCPTSHVAGWPQHPEYAARQARLLEQIIGDYNILISAVADDVAEAEEV